MSEHALYPHVLVDVEHAASLTERGARVIEVSLGSRAFAVGHVPGAQLWDWNIDLHGGSIDDASGREVLIDLIERTGLRESDDLLLYGDNDNWFACWAFWMLQRIGHRSVRIIDGGMRRWADAGLDQQEGCAALPRTRYRAERSQPASVADVEDIYRAFFSPNLHRIIDVRSTDEFSGHMVSALGDSSSHIPTAINIPWSLNCNSDGTFRHPSDLVALYDGFGVSPEQTIVAYCSVGVRASLSWFVLKVLLGYPKVLVYVNSANEWSRLLQTYAASKAA